MKSRNAQSMAEEMTLFSLSDVRCLSNMLMPSFSQSQRHHRSRSHLPFMFTLALLSAIALTACCLPALAAPTSRLPPEAGRDQELFDGHRALRELHRLVRRGNRYYGALRREEIIQLFESRLRAYGAETVRQRFEAEERQSGIRYTLTNIIGRITPPRPQRIVLGTHWDTRLWAEEEPDPTRRAEPIPGANDGTSGIVVLFELARVLKRAPLRHIGVDIALFDGEEFGRPRSRDYCVGSKHMAAELSSLYARPPRAVIVIDMVGDKDLSFPAERSSLTHAPRLEALVRRAGRAVGARAFDTTARGPWITDDQTPFQRLGIPSILLIDYEYPFWHTQQDTPDRCSAESLAQTGQALLATLRMLDRSASRARP